MESLAQELLDAIIDHVPPPDARSCSLVAKRWQKRSQQHHFSHLTFARECEVVSWYTNIPQDPEGIPSYVQDVEFQTIRLWRDPTLFSRVLKCFSRVRFLTIFETGVTYDELYDVVSSGEFGRQLTSLILLLPLCTPPTLMLLITSFPNLKELVVNGVAEVSVASAAPTPPDAVWNMGTLELLELSWVRSKVIHSIARCGITSRRINLAVGDGMTEKILANSSEAVVELVFQDARPPAPVYVFPPADRLPPFPVLTTMEVKVYSGSLSAPLTNILSCIRSAPALSSITFKYPRLIRTVAEDILSPPWIDVDKWLAWLAMHVKSEGGLVVVLTPWPEGNSSWEVCLPEFRKAGGELRVDGGFPRQ